MNNLSTFWEDLKSGRFVSMVKETSQGQMLSNSREVYNVMKPLFAETDVLDHKYQ
jgi:DNA repair protein RadC